MTPEITTVSQQTAAAAATAAGQYVTKVLVHEAPIMTTISNEVVIDDTVYHQVNSSLTPRGSLKQSLHMRQFPYGYRVGVLSDILSFRR